MKGDQPKSEMLFLFMLDKQRLEWNEYVSTLSSQPLNCEGKHNSNFC